MSHVAPIVVVYCVVCFFFQAEDGIRDLGRSRGLGDVYKRQGRDRRRAGRGRHPRGARARYLRGRQPPQRRRHGAVSYTHLTLPTSDLV